MKTLSRIKPKFSCIAALCCSLLTVCSIYADDYRERNTLTLSSRATISVPADELQLSIGVISVSETAEAALRENGIKMQAVINTLEGLGLANSDYQTSHFNIQPTYTPYPKEPPQNWKPSINGYEVSNSIQIKTENLNLAGKLIDEVSKAGANTIDHITFSLKDPQSHRNESISLAAANAKNDAEVTAAAANVKLVQLLSLTLDHSNPITSQPFNQRFSKMAMSSEAAVPIKEGDVDISSTITVVYEIAPE